MSVVGNWSVWNVEVGSWCKVVIRFINVGLLPRFNYTVYVRKLPLTFLRIQLDLQIISVLKTNVTCMLASSGHSVRHLSCQQPWNRFLGPGRGTLIRHAARVSCPHLILIRVTLHLFGFHLRPASKNGYIGTQLKRRTWWEATSIACVSMLTPNKNTSWLRFFRYYPEMGIASGLSLSL
jgi:hypothetical protein